MNLEEAISDYYQWKQKYEQEKQEILQQVISQPITSIKEKRQEYQNLPLPKCISCRRQVGTLWSRPIIEGQIHLYAICGDSSQPCTLLLDIALPVVKNLESVLREVQEDIRKIKEEIVIIKNNLLFGYVSQQQALAQLDTESKGLIEKTKLYEYYYDQYFLKIEQLQIDLNPDENLLGQYIQQFQGLLSEFQQTRQLGKLENANDLLINDIQPLAKKISQSQFVIRKVVSDPPNFILEKQKNSITQLEIVIQSGKVVHWSKLNGVAPPPTTRKKKIEDKPKPKLKLTRKNKP
jgi:hypothetical protein